MTAPSVLGRAIPGHWTPRHVAVNGGGSLLLIGVAGCLGLYSVSDTTQVMAGVLIVAAVSLAATRPTTVIALALILVWTSRLLTVVGAAPRFLDFIDFPLVIAAFVLSSARYLMGDRVLSSEARRVVRLMVPVVAAIAISWAFNNLHEPQRLVAGWILALEPFLLLVAVILAPMTTRERSLLVGILAVLLCGQIAFSLTEFLAGNVGDNVKGSLLKTGAGHHVSAGGAALGYLLLARQRRVPRLFSVGYGLLVLLVCVIADAKQVLFVIPPALLIFGIAGRVRRPRRSAGISAFSGAIVGLLTALVATGAMLLYSGTNYALDFIFRSSENDTGKPAVIAALWHDIAASAQTLMFGLGPGETVSRFAFLTTPGLLKAGSPVTAIGLSVSQGADRYQAIALSGPYSGGSSSFSSAQSSLLGILGDYGIFGFLAFILLILSILRAIRRAPATGIRATALAAWVMLLPLTAVFDWLEQPPFTLAVMLVSGLAIRWVDTTVPVSTNTFSPSISYHQQNDDLETRRGRQMSQTDSINSAQPEAANGQHKAGPGTPLGKGWKSEAAPGRDAQIASYLGMVWRRKVLVVATAVAMAASAYFVSRAQEPVYQSTGQLLINQIALDSNYNATSADLSDSDISDEVALITSPPVAARAAQLGAQSTVTATKSASSHVITVQASNAVPAVAAATVQAYLQAYSDYSQDRVQSRFTEAIDKLKGRIDEFQNTINNALPYDRAALQQQQLRFMEQVTRLEIQRGVTSSSGTVVTSPKIPAFAVSPTPGRDAALALVIGLILGMSAAVLVETVRSRRAGAARTS